MTLNTLLDLEPIVSTQILLVGGTNLGHGLSKIFHAGQMGNVQGLQAHLQF